MSKAARNPPSAVAAAHRKIQREVNAADRRGAQKRSKPAQPKAMQAGLRPYPAPPFPARQKIKPGIESQLRPAPQYLAPDYRGSGKLQDRVAIVTGGDSGIGRAVAVLFAREGADVAIVYLDEHDDALETRRRVEAEGRRCLLLPGNVKDSRFCRSAVNKTVKAFGQLDVLVNNAAFQQHSQSIDDLSEAHFDQTLKTNIYGYFHMAKAAIPAMKPGSAIVNTGSETGLFGHPLLLDYSATKGAIHAFSKALATQLVPRGIRVNVVAPGPVWTPLNPADQPPDKIKTFGSTTAMKRPAQPEEISPAYVFLASPVCSSYITGIVLPVMGGTTGSL
jgi:NAD(P)-dependent dehydrogenase (short-subunit alcohol dehydrogenase family)